ncbi:MAG: MFS transporter [Alphaproteobacteria bacterium]|nr:MFS transporter [Alphaproteobacteria bacterium]
MQSAAIAPRFGALEYREFRLLWIAQLTADFAANMQIFAINWHVFELLHGTGLTVSLFGARIDLSAAAVGLGGIGLVRLVPTLVFGIWGGLLADALDRRRLMMWTRLGVAIIAAGLFAVTLAGLAGVALLYLISAATAALAGFDTPSRQSLLPATVPPEQLSHAVSLFSLAFRISAVLAPLAGAALIGRFAIVAAYGVIAVFFAIPALCLRLMRVTRPDDAPRARPSVAAFVEGLQYVRGMPILWGSFLIDFLSACFTTLGVLLPLLAEVVFDSGVGGYGLLAAGQPIGAVVTGLALAYWHRLRRQGALMMGSVAAYGLAAAMVGLSRSIWLSFALLTVVGAADTVGTVIRGLWRQTMTPEHLRGRVISIALVFFRGGPRMGELLAGLSAALLGAPMAIVAGGMATVTCVAVMIWRHPRMLRFDTLDGPTPGQ